MSRAVYEYKPNDNDNKYDCFLFGEAMTNIPTSFACNRENKSGCDCIILFATLLFFRLYNTNTSLLSVLNKARGPS